MDDLISRQSAIEILGKHCNMDYGKVCGKDCECIEYMAMRDTPSAQKKGHWININEGKWNTCTVLKCSVCGEMDNRMYWTDNFCPNCGADMRGEEDG